MAELSYGEGWARSVYDRLPGVAQDVMTSLYGARQRSRISGPVYREALASLERSQWLGEAEVLALRDEACAEFLARAALSSDYWREAFKSAGVEEGDFGVGCLPALPVLSKEDARENMLRILNGSYASGERRGVSVHTSGTTGMGLHLILSPECWQREYAFRDLHRSWGGVWPGDRIATLAGHPVVPADRMRPPYWRRNVAMNQTLFSSQHMTRGTLPFYLDALRRLRPVMIHGYPSSLYVLALACREAGEDTIRPRAVYCHSETLYDTQRAAIEEAFGCKAFNWYGNTEMTVNIVECERGSLHVKNEHSYVEFLRLDGTLAGVGEFARVVTTGFGNAATPLIRYDTGDMAVLSGSTCDCGRPGPIVCEILGRQEDIFVTPDGRMVGRLDHAFKDALNVVEAQISQLVPESAVVRIVRGPRYSPADEVLVLRELRSRLGQRIGIDFEYVDRIPREASGKFRFAVSKVPLPIRGALQ